MSQLSSAQFKERKRRVDHPPLVKLSDREIKLFHSLPQHRKALLDFLQGKRRTVPSASFRLYLQWFSYTGAWAGADEYHMPADRFNPDSSGFQLGGFGPKQPPTRWCKAHRHPARYRTRAKTKRHGLPLPRKSRTKRSSTAYVQNTTGHRIYNAVIYAYPSDPAPSVRYTDDVSNFTRTLSWSPGTSTNGDHKSPNNWSYTASRLYYASGGWYRSQPGGNGTWQSMTGIMDTSGNSVPRGFTWDRDRAYNNALTSLNQGSSESRSPYRSGVRGNLDISIDLAEWHQTKRMLKSASSVIDYVHSFNPRNAGNKWLEFQYGIRPLVSDLFGVADRMVDHNVNNVRVYRGTSSEVLPMSILSAYSLAPIWLRSSLPWDYFGYSDTGVLKQLCALKVRMKTRNVFDIRKWGTLNPVGLGWELLPYSFVVDWFVDVSSYLRNLETAMLFHSDFVDGHSSELYIADVVTNASAVKHFGPFATEEIQYGATQQQSYVRKFVRTRLNGYPAPRVPTIDARLGWQRLLSGAALISQFFDKRLDSLFGKPERNYSTLPSTDPRSIYARSNRH